MRRVLFAAMAMMPMAMSAPAFAETEDQCAAKWKTADTNADGTVSDTEAARIHAALRVANKPVADGKLDQATFMTHCKDGVFKTAVAEPEAPFKGANSFTEAQAKDRAMSAGLTSVSKLAKDADGIWRGTAIEGEKSVQVAIDFKGNVVAK